MSRPAVDPPPSSNYPTSPAGGWLYRVAYVDQRGRIRQRYFRREQQARAWAIDIVEAGGQPRLHKVRLPRWKEFAGWFD